MDKGEPAQGPGELQDNSPDLFDQLLQPPPTGASPAMTDPAFRNLPLQAVARELVRKIVPASVVAQRHGMTEAQLVLLCRQPGFKKLAQAERALWEGSDNAGERAKAYHREGQAFTASTVVNWILDESLPIAARMDAAKLSARIAGVDTPPKGEGGNIVAQPGTVFAVNFHFADRPPERISTTVEGVAEAPEQPAQGKLDL